MKIAWIGLLLAGVAGAQTGFRVWVKTSPCSGRGDWITVARENPTAGGSMYEPATRIQSPLACAGPQGCTFAAAQAEAAVVRTSASFSNFCCREYSVVRNNATQEMFVYRGWTARLNFTEVRNGLCCEEASAIAGKPNSACPQASNTRPPTPPVIPPRPPIRGRGGARPAGTVLGCFRDTPTFDLNGSLERSRANTPASCIAACRRKGFPLAAVQYGESCLCGDTFGRYGAADNCNMRCTGDPNQTCGGPNANLVLATGLPGGTQVDPPRVTNPPNPPVTPPRPPVNPPNPPVNPPVTPPRPPVVERPGSLVGRVTVTPPKREENKFPNGRLSGERTCKYSANTNRFEQNQWDDKGTRTHHALLGWNFDGIPGSLSPGQTVAITVTGGVLEEFPANSASGYALSGVVAVYGDIDMRSAQQGDRGHRTGRYEFTVRPNARKVEIHTGGAPCDTAAIWKYGN